MSLDSEVLIIGAGMSGLGFAIQLIRKYDLRSFEIIEKADDVGGTWLVNSYPGCGCDVASHFYSYSFALNPDWTHKFSLRPEIQQYFRGLAEQYQILPHVRFHSIVKTARWNNNGQHWEVLIQDTASQVTYSRRCRILISAVGSLSIPKPCEIPGIQSFPGPVFHSAQWNHQFDWTGKEVVVVGNGCSATQFVPIMAETAGKITQFARQAHYLAERPNPTYGPTFKAIMRYVPGAMRLYRFVLYADMEKDFAGFNIRSGAWIRRRLKTENELYVKQMAPEKYWDALIPKHEIGCKRKVMDTDYLATLHRDNVELIPDDPVKEIVPAGVLTKSGKTVKADAIILASGFEVHRMLFPMEIVGENGISLNEHWDTHHQGAAQAYFGTCIPGFKNFFTLMGPNTVTGHLSVIYTVECQINCILRLLDPILKASQPRPSILPILRVNSVDVKKDATIRDCSWMQSRLQKLVWSSGCTSWALDPKTGMNIAMYPEYQFLFWWRSIFIKSDDFDYICATKNGQVQRHLTIGGWKGIARCLNATLAVLIVASAAVGLRRARWGDLQNLSIGGMRTWLPSLRG